MGDDLREESIFGFSGPEARIEATFVMIPTEEPREMPKKNQTPLLLASPPVPSLHQVASVLSPQS